MQLKSRDFDSYSNLTRGNCILCEYEAAAALSAIMIELFIRGIISLAFPFLPLLLLLLHAPRVYSHPSFISLPADTSLRTSLRRIVAFCNFPYVSASRISRRLTRVFLRYFRDTAHYRCYRDEPDEATRVPVNF